MKFRQAAKRVSSSAEGMRETLADNMGLVVGLLAATVLLLGGLLVVTIWKEPGA